MSSISNIKPVEQNTNTDYAVLNELIQNAEKMPSAPLHPCLVIFKRISDNKSVEFKDKINLAQRIFDLSLKKEAYLNECRWGFLKKLWSAVRNFFTLNSFATSSTIGQAMSVEILRKNTCHLASDANTGPSHVLLLEDDQLLVKNRDSSSSKSSATGDSRNESPIETDAGQVDEGSFNRFVEPDDTSSNASFYSCFSSSDQIPSSDDSQNALKNETNSPKKANGSLSEQSANPIPTPTTEITTREHEIAKGNIKEAYMKLIECHSAWPDNFKENEKEFFITLYTELSEKSPKMAMNVFQLILTVLKGIQIESFSIEDSKNENEFILIPVITNQLKGTFGSAAFKIEKNHFKVRISLDPKNDTCDIFFGNKLSITALAAKVFCDKVAVVGQKVKTSPNYGRYDYLSPPIISGAMLIPDNPLKSLFSTDGMDIDDAISLWNLVEW